MSGMTVATGATAWVGLSKVGQSYETVTDDAMPSLEQLNQMYLAYRGVRINLRSLGLDNLTPEQAKEYTQAVKSQIEAYEKADKEYRSSPFQPGEEELYEKLNKKWLHFKDIGIRALELYADGSPEALKELNHIFRYECPEAAHAYTAAVEDIKKFQTDFAGRAVSEARSASNHINWIVLLTTVFGVMGGLLVGYFFASSVTKTLSQLAESLFQNANNVADASKSIAGSTQILSEASTEQAASVQQTAASLEEITAMIVKASDSASSSAERSSESQQSAEQGRHAVDEMIRAMGDINLSNEEILKQVNENAQQMNEIVEVIRGIGAKTKVINEIVFQTKLLSFNASVEAARAGENGKGFAVVAEEVGNLAKMSGGAAKDISDMLESSMARVRQIADDTKSKVESMVGNAKLKVETGTDVAQRCASVLNSIVQNVSEVAHLSQEISIANREQTQGVSEINKAVSQLDLVTQKNAMAGDQTATAAKGLFEQSQALEESVRTLLVVVNGTPASEQIVSAPEVHQPVSQAA